MESVKWKIDGLIVKFTMVDLLEKQNLFNDISEIYFTVRNKYIFRYAHEHTIKWYFIEIMNEFMLDHN